MKTPQVPAMPGMTPLGLKPLNKRDAAIAKRIDAFFNPIGADQKTVAERQWQAPSKPNAEQKPCDHGLFGDEHLQAELFKTGVR